MLGSRFGLFVGFLLFALVTNAQDTIWISMLKESSAVKDNAHSYSVIHKNKKDTQQVREEFFSIDGKKQSERNFCPYTPKKITDGLFKRYSDGRLRALSVFVNGKLTGSSTTYWEDGSLRRRDIYDKDSLVKKNCYTRDGRDTAWYESIVDAEYPGGRDSMVRFIRNNMVYPSDARRAEIEGTVRVKFVIGKDGTIEDAVVEKSVHPFLDEAAVKLISKMPKWRPAVQDDLLVKRYMVLPIAYRLE